VRSREAPTVNKKPTKVNKLGAIHLGVI